MNDIQGGRALVSMSWVPFRPATNNPTSLSTRIGADAYARTHSTYLEEEEKEREGGIFCNQRNGNMLLVRLMPLEREGRREGGEVGLVCGRGENMGDCRHGAVELKPDQLIVAYLRHCIF